MPETTQLPLPLDDSNPPTPDEKAAPQPLPSVEMPPPERLLATILDEESIPRLEALSARLLEDGSAARIAAELERYVHPPLVTRLLGKPTPEQRINAIHMIVLLGHPVDVKPFITAMWGRSSRVRLAAATALGVIGAWPAIPDEEAGRIVNGLIVALHHRYAEIRTVAAQSLAALNAWPAIPAMIERLDVEKNRDVREAVALAMGQIGKPEAAEPILDAYDKDRLGYRVSYDALIAMGQPAAEPLLGVVRRWNIRVVSRALAADVLAHLGTQEAVEPLIIIMSRPHEHEVVRVAAARALGVLGDRAAIPALEAVRREETDPGPYVRKAVAEALTRLSPPGTTSP